MVSAMAEVSSSSLPGGVDTDTESIPMSISGISTALVLAQAATNSTTRPTDTSMPCHRWRTK